MKKILQILIIIIAEVLSLIYIDFDKGMIVLIWTACIGYFALKQLFPQSLSNAVAENHSLGNANAHIPDMSLSSEKNFNNRVRALAKEREGIKTKWIYLGLTLINVLLLILVMNEIIVIK